ncbi:MAG: acetylxylan esterase [Phycisphaerae bacterium]|nr:acetylxylan esterase [Phycisphaerae bacterium]
MGTDGFGAQSSESRAADRQLAEYFRVETAKLQNGCLSDVKSLDDWKAKRIVYRQQLLEMLGLDPFPEKTPLNATVTGTVDHEQFTVENLHFQSMPGLYVTGNLYVPKNLDKPAPAILYVCGHGAVKKDNLSYGNKVGYQHHGAWFARHGYVCLVIDTVQLGEIEGIHHGTYRYNMWWWNSRGYTSAGVEAWNCVRSLDYLESRKEVDPNRIGVTGRSGGGAYSWWIAAIDERIKAAVPVAGITDLQNHVVDGTVEGHCDCMFIVNTYRWDYPMVAALVAPRPLLISNTDKDDIFPLDGVYRLHQKVREIYRLYGAEDKLGLQITEGPHKDTQELRIHAFVWFNRFLKGENPVISEPAERFFEPEQLRVFKDLPADQINTKIQETFVPTAKTPQTPQSPEDWAAMRDGWMKALQEKVFRGWSGPREAGPLDLDRIFSAEAEGVRLAAYDFTSQPNVRLRLFCVEGDSPREGVTVNVLDEAGWAKWLAAMRVGFEKNLGEYTLPDADPSAFDGIRKAAVEGKRTLVYVCPRGIGPDAWSGDARKQIQIRRRFMLLGQTADGMRVWDVRRTLAAFKLLDPAAARAITVGARGDMAGIVLYASLFEPGIGRLELTDLPTTHSQGPIFLNVLRYLDTPQGVALAAERTNVLLCGGTTDAWRFPQSVGESLKWGGERLVVETGGQSSASQ